MPRHIKITNPEVPLCKPDQRAHYKEAAWKIGKSIMIAGAAAALTTFLQILQLKVAESNPMLVQGTLSVVIATIKAVLGVITKL